MESEQRALCAHASACNVNEQKRKLPVCATKRDNHLFPSALIPFHHFGHDIIQSMTDMNIYLLDKRLFVSMFRKSMNCF